MEQAGTAVAAAVRAVALDQGRLGARPDPRDVRPRQQRRRRLRRGPPARPPRPAPSSSSSSPRRPSPGRRDAAVNWDRLANEPTVTRIHAPSTRDLAILGQGIEKASVIVDALLGTGVRGALRDPIRTAVEMIRRAAAGGVPVVAVDTPTAVDLTSGEASDPAVRADLTVTFHRPKTGLLTRAGRRAGRQGPRRPDRNSAGGRPCLTADPGNPPQIRRGPRLRLARGPPRRRRSSSRSCSESRWSRRSCPTVRAGSSSSRRSRSSSSPSGTVLVLASLLRGSRRS